MIVNVFACVAYKCCFIYICGFNLWCNRLTLYFFFALLWCTNCPVLGRTRVHIHVVPLKRQECWERRKAVPLCLQEKCSAAHACPLTTQLRKPACIWANIWEPFFKCLQLNRKTTKQEAILISRVPRLNLCSCRIFGTGISLRRLIKTASLNAYI